MFPFKCCCSLGPKLLELWGWAIGLYKCTVVPSDQQSTPDSIPVLVTFLGTVIKYTDQNNLGDKMTFYGKTCTNSKGAYEDARFYQLIRKYRLGSEETSQWLRALTGPGFNSQHHVRQLRTPGKLIILASKSTCPCVYTATPTPTHTEL